VAAPGTALALAGVAVPSGTIVVVVRGAAPREWPPEVFATIARAGHSAVRIDDVRLAPFYALAGGVTAILVDARTLDMGALVALRGCREHIRSLAIVVVAFEPAPSVLMRALESGATACLSWPVSSEALAQALHGGAP